MAKKNTPAKKKTTTAAAAVKRTVGKIVTEVRNTAIPKLKPARKAKAVTREQIAVRAFEIYASGASGDETDNWLRAERELRGI
ncbi:MAG: hypothetical protein WBD40_19275 [Tepidisphaeraceae bacterium]